jgi:peroxiredoxin
MNELQSRLGARGLQVLGINLDAKREDANRFLAQHPARFALGFDPSGDSAKRFGIKAMPSSVLIGADGRVLFTHAGFREEQRAELEQRITAALPAR